MAFQTCAWLTFKWKILKSHSLWLIKFREIWNEMSNCHSTAFRMDINTSKSLSKFSRFFLRNVQQQCVFDNVLLLELSSRQQNFIG